MSVFQFNMLAEKIRLFFLIMLCKVEWLLRSSFYFLQIKHLVHNLRRIVTVQLEIWSDGILEQIYADILNNWIGFLNFKSTFINHKIVLLFHKEINIHILFAQLIPFINKLRLGLLNSLLIMRHHFVHSLNHLFQCWQFSYKQRTALTKFKILTDIVAILSIIDTLFQRLNIL